MLKSLVVLLGVTVLAAGPAMAAANYSPAQAAGAGYPAARLAGAAGAFPAVQVADNDITTIASPFLWSATKGPDGSVSFAGHVPSKDVHDTLLDGIAKVGGDTTTVADGAPDGFAANAVAALVVLTDLDSGKVAYDGSGWSVSGAVDTADKAASAQTAFDTSPLKQVDASYLVAGPVAPPAAAPATPVPLAPLGNYAWSAEKAADGSFTFTGSVPTLMLKGFLANHVGGKPVDNTAVQDGAPKSFPGATLYGLNALMDLDTGKLALTAGKWSLSGVAKTDDAAKAATAALGVIDTKDWAFDIKTAPSAAVAAVTPPAAPAATVAAAAAPAAPYNWSAEKAADGTFTFSGSVPTAMLKGFLANHVGGKPVDNTSVAAGAPATFPGGTLYGLNALMGLDSGKLTLANGVWSLTGTAKTDDAGKAALGALAVIDTKAWKIDITTAPAAVAAAAPAAASAPAAPAATPVAAPQSAAAAPAGDFTFTAIKAAGGPIVLSGDVPSDDAKSYVATFAGKVSNENLKVVTPGPADFAANVLGGIDALGKLDAGQLTFAGGKWSLKGSAGTTAVRNSVLDGFTILPASADFAASDIAGPPPFAVCTEGLTAFQHGGGVINFDGRTTQFSKGVEAQLDAVATVLKACPAVRVDVAGSTDSDGPADANMALSVSRAEAVVDALVKRGVDAQRLYAVGYGETLPLVPNTSKANKAKNRRIDFKLVAAK